MPTTIETLSSGLKRAIPATGSGGQLIHDNVGLLDTFLDSRAVTNKSSFYTENYGDGTAFTDTEDILFAAGEVGPNDIVEIKSRGYCEGGNHTNLEIRQQVLLVGSGDPVTTMSLNLEGSASGIIVSDCTVSRLKPASQPVLIQSSYLESDLTQLAAGWVVWSAPSITSAFTLRLTTQLLVTSGSDPNYHELDILNHVNILKGMV